MDKIRCKICGSDKNKFILEKDGFKILQCKNCRVAFANPLLSTDELSKIYNREDYYTEIIARNERQKQDDKLFWEKILEDIDRLADKKGRLLDVGSGTGFFLNLAGARKWEVYGVEPSEFAYNYSMQRYNFNIINKPLKEANFPETYFDIVTLWYILEHLSDPLDILYDVNKILRVNGLVTISVPNIDSFEAALFKNSWGMLRPKDKGHMYYYTAHTMKYILNKTGFKIEKIFSVGGLGFRPHILKQWPYGPDCRNSIILEGVASAIRRIVGMIKKGGILVVLARKIKDKQ